MRYSEPGHRGLGRSLYDEISARIGDGTWGPGAALPSTRALAAERGLSRTTVSLVYEQLAADGVIETRPGSASRVIAGVAPARRTRRGNQGGAEAVRARPDPARLSAVGARIAAMAPV